MKSSQPEAKHGIVVNGYQLKTTGTRYHKSYLKLVRKKIVKYFLFLTSSVAKVLVLFDTTSMSVFLLSANTSIYSSLFINSCCNLFNWMKLLLHEYIWYFKTLPSEQTAQYSNK